MRSSGGWSFKSKRRCWVAAVAVAILLLLFALRRGVAQPQTPNFSRDVVVLDPAHGGGDSGAKISDSVQEKDVTLELAARVRSLLTARGFTVVSTRDGAGLSSGTSTGLSTDQRAELANKSHAVACLVIHASGSGNGVSIGVSTIGSPLASVADPRAAQSVGAVPWDRAQEAYLAQSLLLANKIGAAMERSNLPLAIGRAAMKPLDNLECPAVSIELAPLMHSDRDSTPVSDPAYQQRVADTIAGALVFWRNQAQPPASISVPRPNGVEAGP